MAAPVRIDELSAGSLSAGAAVAVVLGGNTRQVPASSFITDAASFTQAGTGATSTTIQSEGQQWFRPEQFGATGGSDDTTAFQNCINAANSAGGGWIRCVPGRTYIVSGLTPKQGVYIDLNGATLKLKDSSEVPVIYDGRTSGSTFKHFGVMNGTINGNKAANFAGNQSAGIFWFTNWDFLVFKNLNIQNAFRNVFNFFGARFVAIENIDCITCGTNSGGFFSYGATFDQSTTPVNSQFIHIKNFSVSNMWGFGMHFSKAEDFVAENLTFDTLDQTGTAIAITCTQAKRGRLTNIYCNDVDGDNIEYNSSEDIVTENVRIVAAGDVPLLFGDNNTGNSNERLILRNVETTSTAGSTTAQLNYATDVSFEHCSFDKAYGLTAANPRTNIHFVDCTWTSVALFANAVQINEIWHTNSSFSDWTILESSRNTIRAALDSQGVANAGVLNVDMSLLDRAITTGTGNGGIIRTTTSLNSNFAQGSHQFAYFYHFGTTLNISATTNAVDGSVARQLTYSADSANQRIQLTNNTGVTLDVAVVVDIISGNP